MTGTGSPMQPMSDGEATGARVASIGDGTDRQRVDIQHVDLAVGEGEARTDGRRGNDERWFVETHLDGGAER